MNESSSYNVRNGYYKNSSSNNNGSRNHNSSFDSDSFQDLAKRLREQARMLRKNRKNNEIEFTKIKEGQTIQKGFKIL